MFKIYDYKNESLEIQRLLSDVYSVDIEDLKVLHKSRSDLFKNDPVRHTDGTTDWIKEADTKFHKKFYNYLNSNSGLRVQNWYKKFIVENVSPWFTESFIFQKSPSFRIHLPNLQAIQKWHYDSDEDHGHPLWEINFHIPVTEASGTNALWVESIPGLQDFRPIELKTNQYAIFDGNRCTHGNKINDTNHTRISFDFRIMPIRFYDANTKKISATTKRRFAIGGYYELFEK